jgi:hypothetical protein
MKAGVIAKMTPAEPVLNLRYQANRLTRETGQLNYGRFSLN